MATMSLLFPVREGCLHTIHKSVVDWLKEPSRQGQEFTITAADSSQADNELAHCLNERTVSVLDRYHRGGKVKELSLSDVFTLRHLVWHSVRASKVSVANRRLLDFDWLVVRAELQQLDAVIFDSKLATAGTRCREQLSNKCRVLTRTARRQRDIRQGHDRVRRYMAVLVECVRYGS